MFNDIFKIKGIEQFNPRDNKPNNEQLQWLKNKFKEYVHPLIIKDLTEEKYVEAWKTGVYLNKDDVKKYTINHKLFNINTECDSLYVLIKDCLINKNKIKYITKKRKKEYIKYIIKKANLKFSSIINNSGEEYYIPEDFILLESNLKGVYEYNLKTYLKEDLISSCKCLFGNKKEQKKRYRKYLIKSYLNKNRKYPLLSNKELDKLLVYGYKEEVESKYPNYFKYNKNAYIPSKEEWKNNISNKKENKELALIELLAMPKFIPDINQFGDRVAPPTEEQLIWLKEKYKEEEIVNYYKHQLIYSWYTGLFPDFKTKTLLDFDYYCNLYFNSLF